MKKHYLAYFLLSSLFVGCNNDNELLTEQVSEDDKGYIILQERDPNSPLILSIKDNTRSTFTNQRDGLTFKDFLGRGYKADLLPMGNPEAITSPIIDIQKLKTDHPSYFSDPKPLNKSDATSFSYSSFERFTENSSTTRKINSGFSLNMGLFSVGSKEFLTDIFTKSVIEESNRVFGELDVICRSDQYTMQTSSSILENIKQKYLLEDFKLELYNTHPSELFYNYGGFILSSFITGGKAVAIYSGSYKGTDTSETKERNMNMDINASYGFSKDNDDSLSGNLGFGKDYSYGKTTSNKFSNISTSVSTIGGSLVIPAFTPPQDINSININLSGWLSSLNDKSTHSVIDIADNGLIPLADLIPEINLKEKFSQYYKTGIKQNDIKKLRAPYIIIYFDQRYGGSFGIRIIYATFYNRFGDSINLMSKGIDITADLKNETRIMIEEINKTFNNIEIITPYSSYSYSYPSSPQASNNDRDFIKKELTWNIFADGNMKKFIDSPNNTIYIYGSYDYKHNLKKIAYSIHYDFILDTYGLKEYVNKLPSQEISHEELRKYPIHAL